MSFWTIWDLFILTLYNCLLSTEAGGGQYIKTALRICCPELGLAGSLKTSKSPVNTCVV